MHGYEFDPVTDDSAEYPTHQEAALYVHKWLLHSPAANKPVEDILDPQYQGMFVWPAADALGKLASTVPAAYLSQRQLTGAHQLVDPWTSWVGVEAPIHEISSVVVDPALRKLGVASWAVTHFAHDLQTNVFEGATLVAIAHEGSVGVFKNAGFKVLESHNLPAEPSKFGKRLDEAGKILVARSVDEIPPLEWG